MLAKYLPLLWANLRRKPLRTVLTFASILVAFLLFGLLQTVSSALTGSASLAGIDRLVTMHRISLIMPLPLNYLDRIRGVDGVRSATSHNWFGGIYQDERNAIAAVTTDVASFIEVYPEYGLAPAQSAAWLADRTGAIVGRTLAERYGWEQGDTIPLRSGFNVRADGSSTWEVNVVAVYDAANGDNSALYMHYDYLNEALPAGARDMIGWVALRIEDPAQAPEIAAAIDAMFANSSSETKTSTESAFIQTFANAMGNIGAIVITVTSAVFFTMLLVTANTMAQSVRERTKEIAVLKTLGFSSLGVTALIVAEALLVTTLGAATGLGLAAVASNQVAVLLQQYFPVIGTPARTYVIGALLVLVLGGLTAALPSVQAWRLRITDALARA